MPDTMDPEMLPPAAASPGTRPTVYRHRIATRLWHWVNAIAIFVLLGSGLTILNAHPHLYWGVYGANFDHAWLHTPHWPSYLTIPAGYNLAIARRWHLTFALVFAFSLLFLMIASVFVFKERFSRGQVVGLVVLIAGFGLFFNQRLEELLTSLGTYTAGVLTILLATSIWVFYALGQKQLLTVWNSLQVMMVIYLTCALLLTPWAHPLEALQLSPLQGWLLLACCMNTLVAYGAFAEALAHWEASRVSATLALTPLVTFVAVALAAWLWPDYVQAEEINALGYAGALVVVLGSATVALAPSLLAGLKARRLRLAS